MELKSFYLAGFHYRQEYVRCGKERCKKCRDGAAHGPYWYAYSRASAYLKKHYVGKELPDEIKKWAPERVLE